MDIAAITEFRTIEGRCYMNLIIGNKIKWSTIGLGLLFFLAPFSLAFADELAELQKLNANFTAQEDLTRTQLAQALINYNAAEKLKEFQLGQFRYYLQAPGISSAMDAGEKIGAGDFSKGVINKVGFNILDGFPINPINVPLVATVTPARQLYDAVLGPYIALSPNADQATKAKTLSVLNYATLSHNKSLDAPTMAQTDTLIKILTNPFPVSLNISPQMTKDDVDNAAQRVATEAALSVALTALNNIQAMRAPAPPPAPLPGVQNIVKPVPGPSLLEVMEKESSWRMTNPEWFQQMAVASNESLLREIANMMAFKMWMDYQTYRQNEQIAALLSVLVSGQSSMASTMAQLNKIMAQSQAQLKAAGQ